MSNRTVGEWCRISRPHHNQWAWPFGIPHNLVARLDWSESQSVPSSGSWEARPSPVNPLFASRYLSEPEPIPVVGCERYSGYSWARRDTT